MRSESFRDDGVMSGRVKRGGGYSVCGSCELARFDHTRAIPASISRREFRPPRKRSTLR